MEETQGEKSNSQQPSPLRQIRTFQGDVASALENQRESLYSIQEAEKLKRASGGTVPNTSPAPRRSRFALLFLSTILFLVLGGAGAWFAYGEYLRKTAPPVVEVPQSRFINPQSSANIDVTNTSRETLISQVTDESEGVGDTELKHLILRVGDDNAPLETTQQFFSLMGSHAPGNLVRALDPVFMLGSLGKDRFLIFKLNSYDNAFGGMLNWEQSMASDIGPLFATSQLVKNIAPTDVFKDVVSKNKDVRVLYAPVSPESTSTAPVLLYSFFNNQMLIVTDSLEALHTLTDRLTQELLVH